ncbi:TMEM256 [Cordylochernes scorpioides]|uniref:TMEM256 n=1 Tax=Cordylochernes scorpioides TaxID=51811 RepID=A0ABY6KR75_9ARAC|nr:TMEM256 [Cordylochernes scorpioides]
MEILQELYQQKDVSEERKQAFDVANRYHFLHTLALLAVPLAGKPYLVGGLMTSGVLMFSGPCYHFALTGSRLMKPVTPYGGTLLILAWLAFLI